MALVLGVSAGVLSAVRPNSLVDAVSMFIALVGISMPVFWLGLMFMYRVFIPTGVVPDGGARDVETSRLARAHARFGLGGDYRPHDPLQHVGGSAARLRAYRPGERLAGAGHRLKHAFRNALIPIVTVTGLQFGTLLGGAVLTESVFAWPGIGRLMVESIIARDYPVVQMAVLVVALAFILLNLLVDILYAYVDPAIRYD